MPLWIAIALGLVLGNVLGFVIGIVYDLVLDGLAGNSLTIAIALSPPPAPPPAPTLLRSLVTLVALPMNVLSWIAVHIAPFVTGIPPRIVFVGMLVVHCVLTALFYTGASTAVASFSVPAAGPIPINPAEAFCRTALLGMNAGVNLLLLLRLSVVLNLASLPAFVASPGVSLGAWALLLLSVFFLPWAIWLLIVFGCEVNLSRHPVYQGFLGWLAWLMPMSWPNTLLGFVIFVVDIVLAPLPITPRNVTGPGGVPWRFDPALKPHRFDWRTGTVVTHGGFLTFVGGAYNNGNFVYVNVNVTDFPDTGGAQTVSHHVWHETGHTLDNAAFGWIYELADSIDQLLLRSGMTAYGERTAESHLRVSPGSPQTRALPYIPIWGSAHNLPPAAAIAASATDVAVNTTVTLSGTLTDLDGTTGTFFWRVDRGANAVALAPTAYAADVSFVPDTAGNYRVRLIVNDGKENSRAAELAVRAS
jgi:hypothetical protein